MNELEGRELGGLWLIRYRIAKFMGWRLYKIRNPNAIVGSPYLWHSPDDERTPNDQWPEHKELDPFEELGKFDFSGLPDYPADIAAAMPLIENETDFSIEKAGENYHVLIVRTMSEGSGKTLPLAICRAVAIAAEAE